ncbi:hypothetical protein [Actinomadura rudentiformis]|uniref:Uncharacterized protein n=1 Tax=Actinomadura rudentiformis TaxID=359158 RepID=A0A6H9Y7C3_9ACTN|nr:hypothetical protein [Actinomadura rudentiformis]KAB2339776.1 hypothetical protein F8566_46745 [Actinomadura rudentiformis]
MTNPVHPVPVVFDPDIPEPERTILVAHERMLPPPFITIPRPRFGGRGLKVAGLALAQAPVWVYLPTLACWPFTKWIRLLGFAAQVAVFCPILFFGLYGLAFNTVIGVPLQLIAFLVVLTLSGEPQLPKLMRRYQGRYIRPQDLDDQAQVLLERAQTAVATVFGSHVHREGLLDEVRNTVTLPRQLWDVAQTLAEVSRLRAMQARGSLGLSTPRVVEALRPQQKALHLATESVAKRIESLEGYAARTRAADEALLELRAIQALAESNDDYRELLARTVRDELALAEINDLTERARLIEEALHASVEEARRAGLSIVSKAS